MARYLFNAPTNWAYDMTFMLYGTFFMLGAAFTLQRKGHVRTDSFYDRWSPRRQALVDLRLLPVDVPAVRRRLRVPAGATS